MTRITYMGKPVRDSRGRFARFPWIRIVLVVGVVAVGLGMYGDHWVGTQLDAVGSATVVPQVVYAGETMEAKVERMKNDIIEEIAQKESGNVKDADALITVDDNKAGSLPRKDKVSLGCMQYKVSTVQRHYKAIHGTDLSNLEATMLALDCAKAKELAKSAIFAVKGSLWEWTTATQDMASRVAVIRELEE